MATRFRCTTGDWQIDIDEDGYGGAVDTFSVEFEVPFTLSTGNEDVSKPLEDTEITINVLRSSVDIVDYVAGEGVGKFTIVVKKSGSDYYKGYLYPDLCTKQEDGVWNSAKIKGSDLGITKSLYFTSDGTASGTLYDGYDSLLDILSKALYKVGITNTLNISQEYVPDSTINPSSESALQHLSVLQGIYSINGEPVTVFDVLTDICSRFGLKLSQGTDGQWWADQFPEKFSGNLNYSSCTISSSGATVDSTSSVDTEINVDPVATGRTNTVRQTQFLSPYSAVESSYRFSLDFSDLIVNGGMEVLDVDGLENVPKFWTIGSGADVRVIYPPAAGSTVVEIKTPVGSSTRVPALTQSIDYVQDPGGAMYRFGLSYKGADRVDAGNEDQRVRFRVGSHYAAFSFVTISGNVTDPSGDTKLLLNAAINSSSDEVYLRKGVELFTIHATVKLKKDWLYSDTEIFCDVSTRTTKQSDAQWFGVPVSDLESSSSDPLISVGDQMSVVVWTTTPTPMTFPGGTFEAYDERVVYAPMTLADGTKVEGEFEVQIYTPERDGQDFSTFYVNDISAEIFTGETGSRTLTTRAVDSGSNAETLELPTVITGDGPSTTSDSALLVAVSKANSSDTLTRDWGVGSSGTYRLTELVTFRWLNRLALSGRVVRMTVYDPDGAIDIRMNNTVDWGDGRYYPIRLNTNPSKNEFTGTFLKLQSAGLSPVFESEGEDSGSTRAAGTVDTVNFWNELAKISAVNSITELSRLYKVGTYTTLEVEPLEKEVNAGDDGFLLTRPGSIQIPFVFTNNAAIGDTSIDVEDENGNAVDIPVNTSAGSPIFLGDTTAVSLTEDEFVSSFSGDDFCLLNQDCDGSAYTSLSVQPVEDDAEAGTRLKVYNPDTDGWDVFVLTSAAAEGDISISVDNTDEDGSGAQLTASSGQPILYSDRWMGTRITQDKQRIELLAEGTLFKDVFTEEAFCEVATAFTTGGAVTNYDVTVTAVDFDGASNGDVVIKSGKKIRLHLIIGNVLFPFDSNPPAEDTYAFVGKEVTVASDIAQGDTTITVDIDEDISASVGDVFVLPEFTKNGILIENDARITVLEDSITTTVDRDEYALENTVKGALDGTGVTRIPVNLTGNTDLEAGTQLILQDGDEKTKNYTITFQGYTGTVGGNDRAMTISSQNFSNVVDGSYIYYFASDQYSRQRQTADEVSTLVAKTDDVMALTKLDGNVNGTVGYVDVTAENGESDLESLENAGYTIYLKIVDNDSGNDYLVQFSSYSAGRLYFQSNTFINAVDGSPVYLVGEYAFSLIRQANDEIELRVEEDGVISAINLSPESIVIQSDKIELAGEVLIGNNIQSENFSSGLNGWQIQGTGDAEFNSITIRDALIVGLDNGSTIPVGTLQGQIAASNIAKGAQNWNSDIEFSPDPGFEHYRIDHTAGYIKYADGDDYYIPADSLQFNTSGTIYWVYFDPDSDPNDFLTTTNWNTAFNTGNDKRIVVGWGKGTTSGGTVSFLSPNTAGTIISANIINATEVSAIAVNTGQLTISDDLIMGASGTIRNSASDFIIDEDGIEIKGGSSGARVLRFGAGTPTMRMWGDNSKGAILTNEKLQIDSGSDAMLLEGDGHKIIFDYYDSFNGQSGFLTLEGSSSGIKIDSDIRFEFSPDIDMENSPGRPSSGYGRVGVNTDNIIYSVPSGTDPTHYALSVEANPDASTSYTGNPTALIEVVLPDGGKYKLMAVPSYYT